MWRESPVKVRIWQVIYGGLLWLVRPLIPLRLRRRAKTEPAYAQRIPERYGHVPADIAVAPIWFHTVSAGETIGAAPLIRRLMNEFSGHQFLVTTMTPTGSEQVGRLLPDVDHCYAPYDFRAGVRRFFDRVQPQLLVLMETELWPNLIGEACARGVPVYLVNGRLSARSAKGYARLGSFVRHILGQLTHVACQYPEHQSRFIELGMDAAKVSIGGSVKFDAQLPDDHVQNVAELLKRWQLQERPVWIAASTHEGEESMVLAAHKQVVQKIPDAILILVPRHPNRAGQVAALIQENGFSQIAQSSTDAEQSSATAQVLLGDTMGTLLYLYGLAQVAFVGGSLVANGGHNPIEPVLCGCAVTQGPHVFNFAEVADKFAEHQAIGQVLDEASLATTVIDWLVQADARRLFVQRAQQVVTDNGGSLPKLAALLSVEIRRLSA